MSTLIVKIVNETPCDKGPAIVRSILGQDAIASIEPLFPNDVEPDLASLFNVTLVSSASLGNAIARLNRNELIQYAHAPQERKPQ